MKDPLVQKVLQFLRKEESDEAALCQKPFLLAFSGGVDSTALLYLLLECKKKFPFSLHLVHVDHSWRTESAQEAKQIEELCQNLSLPCSIETFSFETVTKNWEDEARKMRFTAIQKVYCEKNCRALLLAHHADDQAETVIKRIFEGADMRFFLGMQSESILYGMKVIKPLLSIPKNTLENYLLQNNITPLVNDYTNLDPKFLRARLRSKMVPFLEEQFGKEITGNLLKLSQKSQEIRDYLQRKIQPYFSTAQEGIFGVYYDLTLLDPLEPLEVDFFVKEVSEREKAGLSYKQRKVLETAILEKKANCRVEVEKRASLVEQFYVDRGRLFLLRKKLPGFSCEMPLEPTILSEESWQVQLTCQQVTEYKKTQVDWRQLWKGKVSVYLPNKAYSLSTKFQKENKDKVPAFLRGCFPSVVENQAVVCDFLSGHPILDNSKKERLMLITLEIKNIDN